MRTLDALLEGRTGGWFINIIVIPLLFFLALVLPPLALPQRVFSAGYESISAKGGGVTVADGTKLAIPEGATRNGTSVKLSAMARDAFMKSPLAQNLPAVLDIKSPLYQPSLQGQVPPLAILSIPIPDGADPLTTVDVYGYIGKKWTKLPFQIYLDDQVIETYLTGAMPEGLAAAWGAGGAVPNAAEDGSASVARGLVGRRFVGGAWRLRGRDALLLGEGEHRLAVRGGAAVSVTGAGEGRVRRRAPACRRNRDPAR